jgi:hypothetical protein
LKWDEEMENEQGVIREGLSEEETSNLRKE